MNPDSKPLPFWRTVWLLLRATGRRASGRRKRQEELLRQRSKSGRDWSGVGFAAAAFFMAIVNGGAAFVVTVAVDSGVRVEVERQGKIMVSRSFLKTAIDATNRSEEFSTPADELVPPATYLNEADGIVERFGGSRDEIEKQLRTAIREHGTRDLVTRSQVTNGLAAVARARSVPAMLGSLVLFWWVVMLVFQGEGLELDLQRRRHPMWEWLFSHPVRPGAVFLAETFAPIAANPMFWSAPIFVGILYGRAYGPPTGMTAALLLGVPITIAAACLGKALEIGVILRFPPRSRGAMIGLMNWMGYASMMLFILCAFVIPKAATALAKALIVFSELPWPWLRLFLGGREDGSFSFLLGAFVCWTAATLAVAGGIWFSVWGAQQGLSGNSGATTELGPSLRTKGARFGKEPLYRKEFLWFVRDRSAIVQTILIPLTVVMFQIFNMRDLISHAQGEWNYLCGAGILFGTYFLLILGPKSLMSEGTALWIALTWPRGLESLLKAKAWLWSLISSGLVALVLCYAAFRFPANIWKIALVGIGWFFFSRSMAEKSVTLVTVPSSSGEAEKIPWGRRWATQLGMLTFSVGVLTQQWQLATIGIVYSYITAAAVWQNFRARLPYLYDPWSEKMPPAPTLMHAMIAISIMVEAVAVLAGALLVFIGRENLAVAQAFSYAICSIVVSIGVSSFLDGRGVSGRDIWQWRGEGSARESKEWRLDDNRLSWRSPVLLLGAGGGLVLGLFAVAYRGLLQYLPGIAEMMRKSQIQVSAMPYLKLSYAIIAVAFAPLAEEYLFRGLLFRALDREWGGWRAVLGSAAFFAIYHPPLSWLPVGVLGIANALLFKKTGRLAPAVVLHMVYNAVVLT